MKNSNSKEHLQHLLYAYELGILDEDESRKFELYLLENLDLLEEALQFDKAADLLRHDPDIRHIIHKLDTANRLTDQPEEKQSASIWGNIWSRVVPTILATAVILMILLVKDWHIDVRTSYEAYASENRVAVMYFDNLADPEDSLQLGKIAANLVITDLSESNFIQVVSSQRLFDLLKILGADSLSRIDLKTAARIAERAEAEWILMGSILQTEPNIIMTSELINRSTGNVIKAEKILGLAGENIFSLVDRLTQEIKSDLNLPMGAYHEANRKVAEITTAMPEAYRYYIKGQENYYKCYYDEAQEYFEKAVEIDSTMAMAYYYLVGLKDRKLITKAVQYADRAGKKEKAYIYVLKAALEGNLNEAVAELEKIIRQYPDEKAAYNLLGQYKYSLQLKREALDDFNKALEIDPLYARVYNVLSYVYDDLGDFEKSIWALNKYIELAPDEANPYNTRGIIYARNGMLEKAIESFHLALKIKPDYVPALSYLGVMNIYLERYQVADSIFNIIYSSEHKYSRSAGGLYRAYVSNYTGKFDEALKILEEGIKEDRQVGISGDYKHLMKARIYAERSQYDSAIYEFERLKQFYDDQKITRIQPVFASPDTGSGGKRRYRIGPA